MNTASGQQVHDDEEPIPRLIYYTAQDLKNLGEKILKPYELTIEQLQPLKALSFTPGLTQRQIGDACNKSAANLTRILDRLQKKRLIERRDNPADRRTSLVFLTGLGESLVKDASAILDSFADKITADIPTEDRQVLRRTLATINANLQDIELNTPTINPAKGR